MTERLCPNCATPVAVDASLCPKCGEQLSYSFPPGAGPSPYSNNPPAASQPPGFAPPPGFGPPPGYAPPPQFDLQQGAAPPAGYGPPAGYAPTPVGFGPPAGGGYPPSPYGYPPAMAGAPKQKSTAGILAILVGALGIHFFYLGQKSWGLVFLLGTILTCGFGALLTTPVSIIQGIMYLCASDEDFYYKYVVQKRLF